MRMVLMASAFVLPVICSADVSTSVSAMAAFGSTTLASCAIAGDKSFDECSSRHSGVGIEGIQVLGAVEGSASANFGSLSAFVNEFASLTGFDPDESLLNGSANASFGDMVTVLGGYGTADIAFYFDGSVVCATDAGGCGFKIKEDGSTAQGLATAGGGCEPFAIYCDSAVPFKFRTSFQSFTFGVPFALDGDAFVSLSGNNGEGRAFGTVNVDLSRIVVLNQSGQPIPFSLKVSSNPEPSSLLLGATLLALAGGIFRKRLTRRF
jgi:hypothetical protein